MPASRLILRLGQLRILFMREIQEQATPPSLDRLVKHLFGFQRAERTPRRVRRFHRANNSHTRTARHVAAH
jgi:hypothetical protein